MRKLFSIALGCAICLLSACSTSSLAYYDDIYATSADVQQKSSTTTGNKYKNEVTEVQPDSIVYEYDEYGNLLDTKTFYPGSSEPQITYYEIPIEDNAKNAAASYNEDDYYDYYYTSRLRRFHVNIGCGFGYYDPYFTNLYWYDYYPSSWGLSIYMGYNWWWPSYYYRPYYYDYGFYHCGFNYGWGWGWHHPYHYWGWNHPCYHHDYFAANYWHNHLDPNHSYYYGHRNSIGPSVGNNNERAERPSDYNHPSNYGNNENNNRYSISTSPSSFNQEYEDLAARYSTGSSSTTSMQATTSTVTSTKPNEGGRRPESMDNTLNNINNAANVSTPTVQNESRITTESRPATTNASSSTSSSSSRINVPEKTNTVSS